MRINKLRKVICLVKFQNRIFTIYVTTSDLQKLSVFLKLKGQQNLLAKIGPTILL